MKVLHSLGEEKSHKFKGDLIIWNGHYKIRKKEEIEEELREKEEQGQKEWEERQRQEEEEMHKQQQEER